MRARVVREFDAPEVCPVLAVRASSMAPEASQIAGVSPGCARQLEVRNIEPVTRAWEPTKKPRGVSASVPLIKSGPAVYQTVTPAVG
jgi:hypothetical protein